ncbi:hypothetical protein EPUS_02253 [Endocarpon pusillum Z07020]|uniref:Uncharacterized protein n=1 Tax=Endocarpon pusillum (strain Z07020 / HMAS-L-300199) TaxID=1263415 RepID=U1I3T2_ENDPU|nr:uncharacterized protein EPUS_02253 [Endocarpon pusillum Z07020]ERF76714.1 hypothetical protein EPUS_02253 [Endocarpon pusillum Z07020]
MSSMASSQLTKLKKIKMIISGQPQICASWSFPSESIEHHHINMEDRSAGMMHDIHLFVDTRVAELVKGGICSQAAGQYLRGRLMSMAENSFLWLDMVLKHIQRGLGHRAADLVRILSNTPEDLQQAYTKYLPPIPATEVAILQSYLRLLVVSSRPLSLTEINVLTATDEEDRECTLTMTADDENAVRGSIQRALGPLVRFPQSTAQFVHSTAREFFLLLGQQPLHPLCNSHGVDPTEAHFFCARLCMTYLLDRSIPADLFDIERLDSPSLDTQSPISDRQRMDDEDMFTSLLIGEVQFLRDKESLGNERCLDIQQRYQAYDYAANNWTYHFARCGSMLDNQFLTMGLDLVSCVAGRSSNWYKYRAYQSYLQMPSFGDSSSIVLAAMFDLYKIVQVLLNSSGHLQTPQMLFPALFWAASRGSYAAVKLLLEHGVPVSSVNTRNVPLAVATRGNFKEICDLLLEASDVDPNKQDSHGKPALVLAAEADHVQILRRILLHKSICVDQADTDGRTALIAASRNGSIECVRVLRKDGRANVNCTDHKGQTSLHHASNAGYLSTLKELLSFPGLDLHVKDHAGRNAISLASQQGHLDVVRFLHHRKVDATSTDLHGRNSISWAANSIKATESIDDSKESVLEYLVRKFPDAADAPDESGWSPLAWAVDTPGYPKSVQILLCCPCVDVNQRDAGGRCLLQWAASSDMKDIAKCLLQRSDIYVNSASNDGWTALFSAASNGKMETLKLILQHKDVDVHHRDSRGMTAADWARINNHLEILDLLRSHA